MLQMSGNTLQQVEKFKYLGLVFTSDGRQNEEIDTRIGKSNAVPRVGFIALWSQNGSFETLTSCQF